MVAITTEAEGKAFFMGFANVINALRKCPKITIGTVQGKLSVVAWDWLQLPTFVLPVNLHSLN